MPVMNIGMQFDRVQRSSWRVCQMVKVMMTFILLCLTVRHSHINMYLHRTNGVSIPQNMRQAQPVQDAAGAVLRKLEPIVVRARNRQAQPMDSVRAKASTRKEEENHRTDSLCRVVVLVQKLVKLRVC